MVGSLEGVELNRLNALSFDDKGFGYIGSNTSTVIYKWNPATNTITQWLD